MKIFEFDRLCGLVSSETITVRVMVPDGYESSGKMYPVLYINDGQDVFEDKDILWGECSMDFKRYYGNYRRFLPEFIIVALECPRERQERTRLYSPFSHKGKGNSPEDSDIAGIGKMYLDWIADDLKPWVDGAFRTRTEADFTGIMGYSTGGLFAIYAALARPDLFSRLAALSSAVYIWKEELEAFLQRGSYGHLKRIYMDVGTNEFGRITTKEEFLEGAELMHRAYLEHGVQPERILYNVYPGAVHSQTDWKMRFPDAIRWIFGDV